MPQAAAAIGILLAGIALVVVGAEAFFDGLLATARRYRISAFFLTILVSGLEIENIVAGLAAALAGFPGAAAGTFLGGTTFITLAVAGLGAVIAPGRASFPAPFLLTTAVAGVPLFLLAQDRELSRLDGGTLIVWFGAAMMLLFRSTSASMFASADAGEAERKRFPLLWLAGGLVTMGAGGELLGIGLQSAVARLGLPATLLGNTAIAAMTEAEELGRVAVPARRGRFDIAAGNIGGTALHFLSLNAGILALAVPLALDEATMQLHLPVAVAAPAVYALVLGARRGLGRPDGTLLAALYVAYVLAAVTGATISMW